MHSKTSNGLYQIIAIWVKENESSIVHRPCPPPSASNARLEKMNWEVTS